MTDDNTVTIDDEAVDLNDIANIDMDAVEAVYSTNTPAGIFQFRTLDAKVDTLDTKNGKRAVIAFEFSIENVLSLVDGALDPAAWIGKKHRETIFITDMAMDIGRAKALMVSAGFEGSGTLTEVLNAFVGHEFIGAVKHRKDKNDADIIYANLNFNKIRPLDAETAEAGEAA